MGRTRDKFGIGEEKTCEISRKLFEKTVFKIVLIFFLISVAPLCVIRFSLYLLPIDLVAPFLDYFTFAGISFSLLILSIFIYRQYALFSNKLEFVPQNVALGKSALRVAHDIRSPLTALSCVISTMASEKGLRANELGQLDILQNCTRRLQEIANELLLDYKNSSDKLRKFSVDSILRELALEFQSQFHKKRCHLRLRLDEPSVAVFGQPSNLSRVFSNVIKNSLDAMDVSSTLYIETSVKNGWAQVQFRDTGTGMDSLTLQAIKKGDRFTSKREGTGFGFQIIRKNLTEFNGKLEIHSSPGEGCEVVIHLPLDKIDRQMQGANLGNVIPYRRSPITF